MWILTTIVFLLILSLLVMVHELGHFLAAKKMGVKVEEFGMGLPPKLFGIQKGGTLYSLNAIPFGGFVRLLGENPDQPLKGKDKNRSLQDKSLQAQAFIICAGVLMNFLLAFLLLCFGFWVGMEPLIVTEEDFFDAVKSGIYEMEPLTGELAGEEALYLPQLAYKGGGVLQDSFVPGAQLTYVNDQRVLTGEDLETLILEGRANRRELFDFQGISPEGEVVYEKNVWLPAESPTIFQINVDSPAMRAGLVLGDEVFSVNGERTFSADQVIESLQKDSDGAVELSVLRGEERLEVPLTLDENNRIGVALSDPLNPVPDLGFYQASFPYKVLKLNKVQYGWSAPVHVVSEMWRLSVLSVHAFGELVGNLVSFQEIPAGVTGPVGIAQLTSVSISEGFSSVIRLIALLSLSLGVMNILPIPALDGGRFVFILFEGITGRKPNRTLEAAIHSIGFVLLLLFIAFITFHDIVRIL